MLIGGFEKRNILIHKIIQTSKTLKFSKKALIKKKFALYYSTMPFLALPLHLFIVFNNILIKSVLCS